MKFLSIIIFLLFPSIVFGGVGNVYYCTGINFVTIKNFRVSEYEPQNFKFKRLKDSIKFGNENNFLKNVILSTKIYDLSGEVFNYSGDNNVMIYDEGKFYFSHTGIGVTVISGKCSIF